MEEENRILRKVDNVKAASIINNAHNLLPPSQKKDDNMGDILIIKELKSEPRLLKMFLELRGLLYDEEKKEVINYTNPVMNQEGSFKYVNQIKHIAEETEFSYFPADEIGSRIVYYFESIIPSIYFYHEEYELDIKDFDYIKNVLFSFIDSSFHKARNGMYGRMITKTYSEDMMNKLLTSGEEKKKGILEKYNPFKAKEK